MNLNNIFCTELKNLLKLEKYLGIQPHLHLKLQIAEKSLTPACKVLQYCWEKNHVESHLILHFSLSRFHIQLLDLMNFHQQLNLHEKLMLRRTGHQVPASWINETVQSSLLFNRRQVCKTFMSI